jgi:hypothetical protein
MELPESISVPLALLPGQAQTGEELRARAKARNLIIGSSYIEHHIGGCAESPKAEMPGVRNTL